MSNFDMTRYNFGVCDVEENYKFYFSYLLSKLHELFIWENVPSTIDIDSLNNQLFINGSTCITQFDSKLYACIGNVGGKQNEYYYPTNYNIANPILGNKIAVISGENQDSVMIYNTRTDKTAVWCLNSSGLFTLIKQTATLLADNIVSISSAQINTRVQSVYTAESEAQARSGEKVLKDLYSGKPYRIITEDELEKLTVHNNNANNTSLISQLIELQQNIIANFYMNIGIKYNGINKKERLITDEINFQDDFLKVNLYTMLDSRVKACEEINNLFGTNISVRLNPILIPMEGDCNESEINDDRNEVSDKDYNTQDADIDEKIIQEDRQNDMEQENTEIPEEIIPELVNAIEELTEAIKEDDSNE